MNAFNDLLCEKIRDELRQSGHRIVFAESCTAGLVCASLGRIPGISEWLAGSACVYQIQTKVDWLNLTEEFIHRHGPVSQPVSERMATGVLAITPQATIAASVTGDLGPNASESTDGKAWCSVAFRSNLNQVTSRLFNLDDDIGKYQSPTEQRHARQISAVQQVLQFCQDRLREN